MKIYTQAQNDEAVNKLPDPIYDFLVGPTLTTIYAGIQKKHNLDLRQLVLFATIANMTLIGLEPESALETNLHQAMHELSNQGAKELVADINDRVFKEAKRRLQENILEPSMLSQLRKQSQLTAEQQAELAEEARFNNLDDDDPAVLAAKKQEELETQKQEEESAKELQAALEAAKNDPPIKTGEEGEEPSDDTEAGDSVKTGAVGVEKKSTIIDEKLGASIETIPVKSSDTIITSGALAKPEFEIKNPEPTKPPAISVQTPKKIYADGVDPYREPID